MQVWRNRQTRMVQVHVSIALMQVQLLLPAPQKLDYIGLLFFFAKNVGRLVIQIFFANCNSKLQQFLSL